MTYTVTILRRAQKELSALPQDVYVRIRDSIWKLADEQLTIRALRENLWVGMRVVD